MTDFSVSLYEGPAMAKTSPRDLSILKVYRLGQSTHQSTVRCERPTKSTTLSEMAPFYNAEKDPSGNCTFKVRLDVGRTTTLMVHGRSLDKVTRPI